VPGYRKPADAVVVTRASKEFGNPFRAKNPDDRAEVAAVVEQFRAHAELRLAAEPGWLAPLVGRPLACFCRDGWPCHADVLLELANASAR
jgi:hypothetical protein